MTQQRGGLPATARWLRESRRAAKFSNAHKLLDAMTAAGYKAPSYGSYGQWESGTVIPREESLATLRAFYAEILPKSVALTIPVDPQAELIAALTAHTKALADFTGTNQAILHAMAALVLGSPETDSLRRTALGAIARGLAGLEPAPAGLPSAEGEPDGRPTR